MILLNSIEELDIWNRCENIAKGMKIGKLLSKELSLADATNLLYDVEIEKIDKEKISDELIDYNDEIVSIEEFGVQETIDITVTGDNLFYCNDILTKNSFGIAATADFICSIYENDSLKEEEKYLFKILKSRYQPVKPSTQKFLMKVVKEKQQLMELDDPRDGIAMEREDDKKEVVKKSPVEPIRPPGLKKPAESKTGWKFA